MKRLIVVLAGLGTVHILVRTAIYSPVVGVDAINFLSTALNFLAGEGWRTFTGKPAVGCPPLFPLLLAAFGWVGIEPLAAGRWINATAFGLTILAAGCWLHSHLRARWLVLAATATIAASLPLSHWMARFMTEPLFILFTLLALMHLASFLHRKTAAPLWSAAVCTALAALTRYPGVVLIGTGVLLLLVRRTPPLTARLKDAVVFGAVSSLPLAVVLTHNWAVSETLTGRAGSSVGHIRSARLHQIVDIFGGWVVPPNAPEGVAYLLCLVVGLVGLAGAAVVLRTTRMHRAGRQPDPEAAPSHFRLGPAIPFGVFALAYLIFMVAVTPFTVAGGLDTRYLLPVYVPLLLTAGLLLDRFLSMEAAGRMVAVRYGLASLVLLAALAHIGLSAQRNLRITAGSQELFPAFPPLPLPQHSETLNYIRTNRLDGRIYSNNPILVWSEARITAPRKYLDLPRVRLNRPKWKEWTGIEAGAYIVWFDRFHDPSIFQFDALDYRLLPGVETVAELADGVVLRVLRRTTLESLNTQRRARKQRYVAQLIHQASQRVERAGWTVYRTGRKLTYLKQPCTPADVQGKFVLHVTPADLADLPAHRQRYGFDNLDFYFDWRDVRRDNECVEIIRLPPYPIRRIYIGQWIARENRTLWDAEFAGAGD